VGAGGAGSRKSNRSERFVDEERSQRSKTDWHKVDPSFQQGKRISKMNWKHISGIRFGEFFLVWLLVAAT